MSTYEPRDKVVEYLKMVLHGPIGGEEEQVSGTPYLRYLTGILFPQGTNIRKAEEAITATAEDEGKAADHAGDEDRGDAGGIDLATEELPSAVGISFMVPDDCTVRCEAWAGRYELEGAPLEEGATDATGTEAAKKRRDRSSDIWKRHPLGNLGAPEVRRLDKASDEDSLAPLFSGRAALRARWRSRGDGKAIVTIALVNLQRAIGRGADPALALFQVGLRCTVQEGILPYPVVDMVHEPGSEDAEVGYLYRLAQPYARGHGAAADWAAPTEGRVLWAEVCFIPTVDVPKATFEVEGDGIDPRCCELAFLARSPRDAVLPALSTMVAAYGCFAQRCRAAVASSGDPLVAGTLVSRIEYWLLRMEAGVALLGEDDTAWRCFQLANEAMGIQMVLSKARPKVPYSRLDRRPPPDLDFKGRTWRPFQIAFMLGAIESLMNGKSIDREVVDVIWFPTGGGKTEAYLLICAFELVRRRLGHAGSDTATAILSRYTLRFLTAQQFQRTAALVVALELMRRQTTSELGGRPFTLGLWVGQTVTPNTFRKAHELFEVELERDKPRNPFQLQACPCCGTEVFPTSGRGRRWSRGDFGVQSTPSSFMFRCVNPACHFTNALPLSVIDEALYQEPPSMLLGTVDKFALLPWDDRSRVFFGGVDDKALPPSLILQDELHLISGPLGSLAAPYDAAIDAIIRSRGNAPKRIGSTATIRNAREQVRGLYGREAAVFPSPGHAWDDAYFFSTDKKEPGRKYVGVMGQGYIKPVVAMAWTCAAVLQSVREVPLPPEALDSYWTVLAYHNSRRELGRTLTAAQDEVQARIRAIASSQALVREVAEPLELSAQMVKSLGEAIEALEKPYVTSSPPVDLVPCTSILSVGVDLERLGIMLMNGQPKLTSEYIQATSRVGRGRVPGLVVSLYSSTKPRDRSHYEDFRAYHESIYRHVEPTSVTPYALPARERTLHAALVSVIRHATEFGANESARLVDFGKPAVKEAIERLMQIVRLADPSEAADAEGLIEYRIHEWSEMSESGGTLLYEHMNAGHQFPALLAKFGEARALAKWPTMMSVRNVDAEVRIRVA